MSVASQEIGVCCTWSVFAACDPISRKNVQEISSGCMRTSSPHHSSENLPGCSKTGMETEVIYDCSNVIQRMQTSRRRMLHRFVTVTHPPLVVPGKEAVEF